MTSIRKMAARDLACVCTLAAQLGYPCTEDALRARMERIAERDDHLLLVACDDADIAIGWMHLCTLSPLEAEAAAQLSAIVVNEAHRGTGVGAALVAEAEAWARARGFDRLMLRSRHDRDAAHGFYRGRGFRATKTSVIFEKELK